MKTVAKSVLLWYSPLEMYALVTDVESYPKFLPWCDRARVLGTQLDGMTAELGLSFGGIRQTFTTRNTHVPGRQVQLELIDGPFKHLNGVWNFIPLGEEQACRVELKLSYSFDSMFGALVGPVFDKIASTLVDAFVKRAESVYQR